VPVVAVAAGFVVAASSSPPHPALASRAATSPAATNFRLDFCLQMSILVTEESHMRGPWTHGNGLLGVDLDRRRVWVCGQRVHHGATGIVLAAFGAFLVAHDWKDRPMWFARGAQDHR
jgi:hypothetical protein